MIKNLILISFFLMVSYQNCGSENTRFSEIQRSQSSCVETGDQGVVDCDGDKIYFIQGFGHTIGLAEVDEQDANRIRLVNPSNGRNAEIEIFKNPDQSFHIEILPNQHPRICMKHLDENGNLLAEESAEASCGSEILWYTKNSTNGYNFAHQGGELIKDPINYFGGPEAPFYGLQCDNKVTIPTQIDEDLIWVNLFRTQAGLSITPLEFACLELASDSSNLRLDYFRSIRIDSNLANTVSANEGSFLVEIRRSDYENIIENYAGSMDAYYPGESLEIEILGDGSSNNLSPEIIQDLNFLFQGQDLWPRL